MLGNPKDICFVAALIRRLKMEESIRAGLGAKTIKVELEDQLGGGKPKKGKPVGETLEERGNEKFTKRDQE